MKLSPLVAALYSEILALELNFLRGFVLFVELIVDVTVSDARLAYFFISHQDDLPCVIWHFIG